MCEPAFCSQFSDVFPDAHIPILEGIFLKNLTKKKTSCIIIDRKVIFQTKKFCAEKLLSAGCAREQGGRKRTAELFACAGAISKIRFRSVRPEKIFRKNGGFFSPFFLFADFFCCLNDKLREADNRSRQLICRSMRRKGRRGRAGKENNKLHALFSTACVSGINML